MKTSPLFLALLFFLITTTLAERPEPIHAKRACNSTVAECNNGDEEWLMESDTARQLLQGGSKQIYKTLQRQPACATSRGGRYTNTCFNPINKPSRGCSGVYRCRPT
ncbi:hypothetical protein QJS04_geneDACA004472 [Acorus gramineus]|uniref:Uncharacterized protein n=1 Tax=Acorus gramineus TaxID=55184 RepID=A0AAV9B417_ACOGR|nr:hypothetical protein QJS04_geneDACA004472 [Acorus gramineus]